MYIYVYIYIYTRRHIYLNEQRIACQGVEPHPVSSCTSRQPPPPSNQNIKNLFLKAKALTV